LKTINETTNEAKMAPEPMMVVSCFEVFFPKKT
jgi:hypothetical protein